MDLPSEMAATKHGKVNQSGVSQLQRRQHGCEASAWAGGLVGLLWIFCPLGAAQKVSPTLRADPFIQAVQTLKHSVAHVDCLAVSDDDPELIDRVGSAFFISEAGEFLTAAHVVMEMQKSTRQCPTSAVTLAFEDWSPQARTEKMAWFVFKASNCRVDTALDVAVCPLSKDSSAKRWDLHLLVEPVQFEWKIPPDGTPVAFTGFPLRARDPMTFRAAVAVYLIPWNGESIPELILDHSALPGFSGSPVYLADGKIVGILVQRTQGEAAGITIARPASVFRAMIEKHPQNK
jgi:S1-C subfamily serine protease